MAGPQTHDPSKTTLTVAGYTIIQFAKGTYITDEYDSDAFSDDVGVGGEVARIVSRDKRGTIKFTLMAASPSNDDLSALAATDRLSGNGVGAVMLKDAGPGGSSKTTGPNAWLKKVPTKTYSTEAMTVEWEIRVAIMDRVVGGTVGA